MGAWFFSAIAASFNKKIERDLRFAPAPHLSRYILEKWMIYEKN